VVLKTVKEEKLQLQEKIVKQKLSCTGHLLRGSSGSSALLIIEGKFEGNKERGRPRRIWIDDIYQ
jgi:hypothetical protein